MSQSTLTRKQQHAANARKPLAVRAAAPVSRNLAARTADTAVPFYGTGPVKRTRGMKMTGAMRDGDVLNNSKRRSLWTQPAELSYSVSVISSDRKWDATVTG